MPHGAGAGYEGGPNKDVEIPRILSPKSRTIPQRRHPQPARSHCPNSRVLLRGGERWRVTLLQEAPRQPFTATFTGPSRAPTPGQALRSAPNTPQAGLEGHSAQCDARATASQTLLLLWFIVSTCMCTDACFPLQKRRGTTCPVSFVDTGVSTDAAILIYFAFCGLWANLTAVNETLSKTLSHSVPI